MKYEYRSIGELGKIVTGKTPPTEIVEYFDGEYPFITPSDIPTFSERYLPYTERTLSKLGADRLKSILLPEQAVCFVCIGSTIGKMCLTKEPSFTNQQINSIIPNKKYDSIYIFYLLRYIKDYFQSIGGGTGSGKGIVNKSVFSKAKIKILRDIQEQKNISNVISKYDDLIEVNNKRIKLLEQTAEEIYKEWFVRFRFPGYENAEFENGIPKGWTAKKLYELLSDDFNGGWGEDEKNEKNYYEGAVIRGTDIPDVYWGLFRNVPVRYHTKNHIVSKQLKENDIVIELSNGNIDNIGRTLLIDKEILAHFSNVMCASFCKTLRFKEPSIAFYVHSLLRFMQKNGLLNFYKNTGTNGINNFNYKRFLKMDVLIPCNYDFINKLALLNQEIIMLRESNYNLAKQRDYLLPRLMSGKLEV